MPDQETILVSCQRGADIDRNELFRQLYTRWMGAEAGRNGTALCVLLDTRKQVVSGYRTGHDGRTPPWWAITRLLDSLTLEIRITAAGVILTQRRGKGPDGPATRRGDSVIPWMMAPA